MGQSVSRLFTLLNSFLTTTVNALRAATTRDNNPRAGQNARRDVHADPSSVEELSAALGRSGRGSPAGAGGFFGSHFLMGGELYDAAKPEVFLFGDQHDLDLLGNKPVQFPHCARGVTDSVGVLNALVNVRKDSVRFMRVGRVSGGYSSGFYRLEFIFDCDVACSIQVHFCAKEVFDENHQHIKIVSKQSQFTPSERFHFSVGANQQFSHYMFKPHRYEMKLLHWEGGTHFPVVIEIRSVSDMFPEQVQTTLCSIERSADQLAALVLKPLKQKLMSGGVVFLLQEIFGIENKENADAAALAEENGAECIICMASPRDTMILPCRHLCICKGCAETLRYKLNNCPICRSPFKALLKIKAMRKSLLGQGIGSDGSMVTTLIRREPMTLVEAINGQFSCAHSGAGPSSDHKAVIARCRGNNVITSTTTIVHHAHPSAAAGSPSPPLPRFSSTSSFPVQQQHQSRAGIVEWLRGNDSIIHRREPPEQELEQIEMEQLALGDRRKDSHSSIGIGAHSMGASRSPSLCRAVGAAHRHHSHSHFSTPNSSYQSARSVKARVDDDEAAEEEEGSGRVVVKPILLQTSAPSLSGSAETGADLAHVEFGELGGGEDQSGTVVPSATKQDMAGPGQGVPLKKAASKAAAKHRKRGDAGEQHKRMSEPPPFSSSASAAAVSLPSDGHAPLGESSGSSRRKMSTKSLASTAKEGRRQ